MAITKSEIKRQVYAMMKERSTAIHKFIQDQAYHVRSEAFKMDEELKKYHDDYYRSIEIAARCANNLADKGLGSMRNTSHSPYVLDRCWKVDEVELYYFVESGSFYPGQSQQNTYLDGVLATYRDNLVNAKVEFRKVLEIIDGMTASRAFNVLKEAGLPLTDKKIDANLPATKLLLNLPEMLGGTNNG